jgi:hypothetical protein
MIFVTYAIDLFLLSTSFALKFDMGRLSTFMIKWIGRR